MSKYNPYSGYGTAFEETQLLLLSEIKESLQSIARSLHDLGASVVLNGVRINNS